MISHKFGGYNVITSPYTKKILYICLKFLKYGISVYILVGLRKKFQNNIRIVIKFLSEIKLTNNELCLLTNLESFIFIFIFFK